MGKCRYEPCHNEAKGRSKYCSGKCRTAHSRQSVTDQTEKSVTNQSVTPEYVTVEGKVYGRQAVRYDLREAWELRPEPLDPHDIPLLNNRGRYTRPDGSQYQFDACGTAFELTNGQVYQSVDEVRACYVSELEPAQNQ